MSSPLDNPFTTLADKAGDKPTRLWRFGGAAIGIIGATLVRMSMERARRRLTEHGEVPLNPADERMGWGRALTWTVFIAVGGALGRLVSQRLLAGLWKRETHRPVAEMPST